MNTGRNDAIPVFAGNGAGLIISTSGKNRSQP